MTYAKAQNQQEVQIIVKTRFSCLKSHDLSRQAVTSLEPLHGVSEFKAHLNYH